MRAADPMNLPTAETSSLPDSLELLNLEQPDQVIRELHRVLLDQRFPSLERYPWPGRAASLYYEPGVLWRYLQGKSNCWRLSACWAAYDRWLRWSNPTLWVLAKTFMRCEPVPIEQLEACLTPERYARLSQAGILTETGSVSRSRLRATPWGHGILWHDAPPAFRESFVFLGEDSLLFARHLTDWLNRHPATRYHRALDLCTGTGIHALMAARAVHEAVGVDLNPRAIAFARLNASLRGVSNVTWLVSDLFADVPPGPYDLVVANLPLLFLPPEVRPHCLDGDAGLMGIELALRVVDGLSPHLAPNGSAILHVNSPIVEGRDLLVEALRQRIGSHGWEMTLTPIHEFHEPKFYPFYATHRIERFVNYFLTIRPGGPAGLRRRRLSPWRKAACLMKIAGVHLQGRGRVS